MQEIKFRVLSGSKSTIAYIELNRPKALNATNTAMLQAMSKQLAVWEQDAHIAAVVIYSADSNYFCAGGDLLDVYKHRHASLEQQLEFFTVEYNLNVQIRTYSKPYIALANGIVMGGGMGISVHGSHMVVGEDVRLAMPECAIGYFPDAGGSYFLPRMPDNAGVYLGLTSLPIGPAAAAKWQLAAYTIASAKFQQIITELPDTDFADNGLDNYLESLSSPLTNKYDAVLESYAADIFADADYATICNKLAAAGEWGDEVLQQLAKLCPLSMLVYLEEYKQGKSLSVEECMQLELRLAKKFLQGPNIYEGIRALLIDKDKLPRWVSE